MNEREKIIRLWFDMWIKKADLGIDNIFTDDVVYTESWSKILTLPDYIISGHGAKGFLRKIFQRSIGSKNV